MPIVMEKRVVIPHAYRRRCLKAAHEVSPTWFYIICTVFLKGNILGGEGKPCSMRSVALHLVNKTDRIKVHIVDNINL